MQKSSVIIFLGSIIIVNNDRCFDVVDGQQRLTTIMLSLCVFRDLLKKGDIEQRSEKLFTDYRKSTL
ncbi:MAG: DUF262 domain-containing protein [Alistipes putredinis]